MKRMNPLNGSDRKRLRALAHHLKPLAYIGKNGLKDAVVEAIDTALEDHELIKVKFNDFKDEKREISEQIAERTQSECVGRIGNISIFFRQNPDPEKRKIQINF